MRFSRAKPVGTYRVYQRSGRRVASHPETLQEARRDAKFWVGVSGAPMEIQERFPSGGWVTLETVEPKARVTKTAMKRAHATMRNLGAVEEALGYMPEARVVERAEASHADYSTNELRREIRSLEDQFEMAGGRGVGLADRLDAARIALALRSSKRSHATRAKSGRSVDLSPRQRGLLRDLRRAKHYQHPLSVEISKDDVAHQLAKMGLLQIEPDNDLGLTWVTVTDKGRKVAMDGDLWRGV